MLDFELQRQLVPHMKDLHPLPGIYDPDFIAANQDTRATNLIKGTRQEQMDAVRADIRSFKSANQVDKVIVLWTANTERFGEVRRHLAGQHPFAVFIRNNISHVFASLVASWDSCQVGATPVSNPLNVASIFTKLGNAWDS